MEKIGGLGGKSNVRTYSKILSDKWRELTDDQRQIYFKKSDDDMKRYYKQCEELISNEYFILEDGSKSSDLNKKTKIKINFSTGDKRRNFFSYCL